MKRLPENFYEMSDDELDQYSDDELDEFFRPMKVNSRKTLAPLYVYLILKERSDRSHHLSQQQILNELEKYPSEIVIERKALGRIIHNLTDSDLGIHTNGKYGTWYEPDTECA